MDALMQEGGIGWLGSGNRRVSFYIEPDFDLLFDDDEIDSPTSDVESLFPEAFRMFRQDSDADAVYWMNATDPGSLAGLQMDAVHGRLPKRLLGNYLTFRGSELVGTIGRSGKDIRMEVAADDDRITSYFGALKHLLYRDVQPQRTVTVETINGQDAASSDYLDVLRTMFDVRIDYKSVMLYRKTSS
jgi:hypothetical protein